MTTPWQIAQDCGDSGLLAVYDAAGRKLALVMAHPDIAPLMAAAPDLLTALQATMTVLEARVGRLSQATVEERAALSFGRAAIRRATQASA